VDSDKNFQTPLYQILDENASEDQCTFPLPADSDKYIQTPSYQIPNEKTSERNCTFPPPAESAKYVIQTALYQILELETSEYYYKIGTSWKVFAEEVYYREPYIDSIQDGIIRLFLGSGTSCSSVQYFDFWKDRASESFFIYSVYADYAAENNTEECLLAYFKFPWNILIIRDIFNEQGFYMEIDRGFISATCNRIVILNENEIYLDYSVFADGYSDEDLIKGNPVEFKNIREVVRFR